MANLTRREFMIGVGSLLAGGVAIAAADRFGIKPSSDLDPFSTKVPNTPIAPIGTPEATETAAVTRIEVMGTNEITSWDAEISITRNITNINLLSQWYSRLDAAKKRGTIREGDIRTHDRIAELVGSDNYVFTKDDGEFPMAKEIVGLSENIGKGVMKKLGFVTIDDQKAKSLGLQILGKTFSWSADGQIIYTRVSVPSVGLGKKREEEPEGYLCAYYVPNIEIGQEQRNGNILLLSNKAPLNFVFNLSDTAINSKYPEIKKLTVYDASGKAQVLSWRCFDFGSQPNTNASLVPPDNYQQYVWGSELFIGCGVVTTKKQPSQGGGRPQQTPTNPPERTPTPPSQQQKGPDPFSNGTNNGSDMGGRIDRGTGGGAGNSDPSVPPGGLSQTGTNEH